MCVPYTITYTCSYKNCPSMLLFQVAQKWCPNRTCGSVDDSDSSGVSAHSRDSVSSSASSDFSDSGTEVLVSDGGTTCGQESSDRCCNNVAVRDKTKASATSSQSSDSGLETTPQHMQDDDCGPLIPKQFNSVSQSLSSVGKGLTSKACHGALTGRLLPSSNIIQQHWAASTGKEVSSIENVSMETADPNPDSDEDADGNQTSGSEFDGGYSIFHIVAYFKATFDNL